jgi:3-dehydrosphinganine reductase
MKKVALITGGSSGLGLAFAKLLGKDGYDVVIVARNQDRINKALAELTGAGVSAKGISCDITDETGLRNVAAQVKKDYGKLDYLVLNAGRVSTVLLSEYTSVAEMKQDLEVDLWGTILSAYILTPLLAEKAKVLLVSSGFGLIGVAGYSIYCAAKAGILNFGESLRRELMHKNINVYATTPGDMDTPQFAEEVKNAPAWMKKETPRKLMKTEEAAANILKQADGKRKYLIIPASDVNLLATLSKILPRKFRDYLLDDMFPRPTA